MIHNGGKLIIDSTDNPRMLPFSIRRCQTAFYSVLWCGCVWLWEWVTGGLARFDAINDPS